MEGFSVASRGVAVRFLVETSYNEFADEPDPMGLALPVAEYGRVRGKVLMSTDAVSPVAPEDDLSALVKNLCFRGVTQLVSQRHAVVALTDTYGYVRLDLEADMVRVSGDHLPDVRFLAQPLLAGLVDCGKRLQEWLPGLRLEGDVAYIVRRLDEHHREARHALEQFRI